MLSLTKDHFDVLPEKDDVLLVLASIIFPILVFTIVALHPLPVSYFSRDMMVVAQSYDGCCSPAMGMLSNIGIVYWCLASGACFLGAALIGWLLASWKHDHARVLIFAGSLTLLLGIDDFFLLHEDVLDRLGMPEKATLLGYGLLICTYAYYSWLKISRRDRFLFLCAASCFALSIAVDILFSYSDFITAIEDGVKFLGVALWCSYCFCLAYNLVALSLNLNRDVLEKVS